MTSHVRSSARFPASVVPFVASLAEQARTLDGAAPFSDDMWRLVRDGRTHYAAYLPADDGDVIGAGFLGRQGDRLAGELLVHPAHRRHGYGDVLIRDLLASSTDEMWLWSHSDHPGARALAARHRLERARELLQLRLDVAAHPPPKAVQPAGVHVRQFVVGQDEEKWLEVNNSAFAWHPEQGSQTLDDIRAATEAPDFDPAGFFLAFRDDELVGFHWTKVHPSDPSPPVGSASREPLGEVYVVGVAPAAHGLGIGAALTTTGLRYLTEQRGVNTVLLYVEGDNRPALAMYRRLGFRRYLTNVAYRRKATT